MSFIIWEEKNKVIFFPLLGTSNQLWIVRFKYAMIRVRGRYENDTPWSVVTDGPSGKF